MIPGFAARRWPWRARWEAVIVGQESGHVSYLDGLITFRRAVDGLRWCARMNSQHSAEYPAQGDRPVTVFELRPLP